MSACAGVAGSRVWGFYIIAAVFNAAGAVAFVLLACLPSLGASFYQAKDRLLSPAARTPLATFWRPSLLPPPPPDERSGATTLLEHLPVTPPLNAPGI